MLLPGPEAMQLATYAGWWLRGVSGGVSGAAVILSLGVLYVLFADVPIIDGIFLG